MRIVSFNVNGLRSIKESYALSQKGQFKDFLQSFEADIICFQETKVNEARKLDHDMVATPDYTGYFSFQQNVKKIGYSGVVTYCKKKNIDNADDGWLPISYEEGFAGVNGNHGSDLGGGGHEALLQRIEFENTTSEELKILDCEGRVMITDHVHFILLNVYFPNDSGPERDAFRWPFYNLFWQRCLNLLELDRSIIIVGDFNVTCHPMDHCDYAHLYRDNCLRLGHDKVEEYLKDFITTGTCPDSSLEQLLKVFYQDKPLRRWMFNLLNFDVEAKSFGLRDVFRQFHPKEFEKYTCWNTQVGARGTNHGTRLDTILVAGPLFNNDPDILVGCDIEPKVMGSDHCPVWIDINLSPPIIKVPVEPPTIKLLLSQKRLLDFFPLKSSIDVKLEATNDEKDISKDDADGKRVKKQSVKLTDFFLPVVQVTTGDNVIELNEPINVCDASAIKGIFGKPKPAPVCRGHNEPCKLLTVTKAGVNQGRKFYLCSRGVGPSSDPSSRCDHFEWHKPSISKH